MRRAHALAVFARPPRPGQAKTRLAREIGADEAAELYRCFLIDLLCRLDTARNAGANSTDLWVAWAPGPHDEPHHPPAEMAAVIGGRRAFAQEGSDLGGRLSHATERLLQSGYRTVTVIGSDSPTLPVEVALAAGPSLDPDEIVLAPAIDGGFWLVALAQAQPLLWEDVAWSTDQALADVRDRATRAGLRVRLGPEWHDVDVRADLQRLADDLAAAPGLCPLTREAMGRLTPPKPAPPA